MKRKFLIILTILSILFTVIVPTYADADLQQIAIDNFTDNGLDIDENFIIISNLEEDNEDLVNSDDDSLCTDDLFTDELSTDEYDLQQSEETPVYASVVNAEYKIVIPKTIILNENKHGNYKIEIIGEIPENTTITIRPDEVITFSTKNKADITGSISQEKLIFSSEDTAECTGLITAEDLDAGTWTGSFKFYISTEYIEPEHTHVYSETPLVQNKIFPTCTEDGSYDLVYYCTECGEELQSVHYIDPAKGHTENDVVFENIVPNSCTTTGSHDEVYYCKDCKIELSRNTIIDPIAPHIPDDNGIFCTKCGQMLIQPGLYDENNNLIKSWDELIELGLDVEKDYAYPDYKTDPTSGYSVFANNNLSGNLILPDTITKIGDRTFRDCTLLESVTLPDGVTSIGVQAFSSCESLNSITIPDSVTSIGANAFGYTSLESVIIPNSVTSMDKNAFYNCASLKSITISDNIASIGNSTFYGCTSLESITIPNSVTSIGNGAFTNCKSLKSIAIPDNVTSIGKNAFGSCNSLESVMISNSVTNIDAGAFQLCTSLKTVTILDGVTSIGASAFWKCSSLESITIPNSVTNIGGEAFLKVKHIYYNGSASGAPWGALAIN